MLALIEVVERRVARLREREGRGSCPITRSFLILNRESRASKNVREERGDRGKREHICSL